MTPEDYTEGNKLIAEFMGFVLHTDKKYPKTPYYINAKKEFELYPDSDDFYMDWDKIMPVVEKIEQIKGVRFEIYQVGCCVYSFGTPIVESRGNNKIEAVNIAVRQFIERHNQTNP